jgi:DNA-binding NtrC family response regulator
MTAGHEEDSAPSPKGAAVLVVDDDEDVLEALELILTQQGCVVTTAMSGDTAVAVAKLKGFDVALTDLRMAGLSGLETLAALKRIDARLPVIVVSGYVTEEAVEEVMSRGAYAYIRKPFDLRELIALVRRALQSRS